MLCLVNKRILAEVIKMNSPAISWCRMTQEYKVAQAIKNSADSENFIALKKKKKIIMRRGK